MKGLKLETKNGNSNFGESGQVLKQPETPKDRKRFENLYIPNGIHRITHPICYECGALMILLHDGKFCPSCGRLVLASEGWKSTHPKYATFEEAAEV